MSSCPDDVTRFARVDCRGRGHVFGVRDEDRFAHISFRAGAEDAPYLEREFLGRFGQVDLMQLSNYRVYLKLMIDGLPSRTLVQLP